MTLTARTTASPISRMGTWWRMVGGSPADLNDGRRAGSSGPLVGHGYSMTRSGMLPITEHYADDLRNSLLEEFQAFAAELRGQGGHSRDIFARTTSGVHHIVIGTARRELHHPPASGLGDGGPAESHRCARRSYRRQGGFPDRAFRRAGRAGSRNGDGAVRGVGGISAGQPRTSLVDRGFEGSYRELSSQVIRRQLRDARSYIRTLMPRDPRSRT
jgi:hypothetical protein